VSSMINITQVRGSAKSNSVSIALSREERLHPNQTNKTLEELDYPLLKCMTKARRLCNASKNSRRTTSFLMLNKGIEPTL
jgi:hypothetical protein